MTYPLYKNRRPDVINTNLWIEREAGELLRQYCPPGRKGTGRFVSQLILQHHARMEERVRLLHTCKTRHEGRPEVVAVQLSVEGKNKLNQLAMLLDKPEAEVLRLLVKWARFVDVSPLRFDRGESEHEELCEV